MIIASKLNLKAKEQKQLIKIVDFFSSVILRCTLLISIDLDIDIDLLIKRSAIQFEFDFKTNIWEHNG